MCWVCHSLSRNVIKSQIVDTSTVDTPRCTPRSDENVRGVVCLRIFYPIPTFLQSKEIYSQTLSLWKIISINAVLILFINNPFERKKIKIFVQIFGKTVSLIYGRSQNPLTYQWIIYKNTLHFFCYINKLISLMDNYNSLLNVIWLNKTKQKGI